VHPSGAQYELRFADQSACVVGVGGGLRTYAVGGRVVLDGYGVEEMCRSGRGQILAPWPNRIRGGAYSFDGEEHQLPLTEPEAGNAIHGLVRWAQWGLVDRDADRVTLEHHLFPQPGYPFAQHLQVEYRLREQGLSVTVTVRNVGDRPCPFGLGFHPYLCGAPKVDDLTLHVPARTPPDLYRPKRIGDTVLDTTFTDLERSSDGLVRVNVDDTVVWADASFKYLQLFTGDTLPDVARRSLAVEPMTCPPNAFRTGEDLIRLEPDQRFTASWGIQPP